MYLLKIKSLIVTFSLLTTFVSTIASQDTCPVVRYTGRFRESDHVKDHALLGRSYKNLTTNTVQECFSVCSHDCRCVSYQLSGRRCELIDDDTHTAPDLFKPLPGYKYYELKQRLKKVQCTEWTLIHGKDRRFACFRHFVSFHNIVTLSIYKHRSSRNESKAPIPYWFSDQAPHVKVLSKLCLVFTVAL